MKRVFLASVALYVFALFLVSQDNTSVPKIALAAASGALAVLVFSREGGDQ